MTENDSADSQGWVELVARIRSNDPATMQQGMQELYRVCSRGAAFLIRRQLGSQDVDDLVHELLVTVTTQIRNGDLKQPECLLGYIRAVAQHQVMDCIQGRSRARREQDVQSWAPPR